MEDLKLTLTKMREIVVQGDPGACGEGCLEDALSQIIHQRSWWAYPEDFDGPLDEFYEDESTYVASLQQLPLYQRLYAKGREMFPNLPPRGEGTLWGISDQISKMQRLDLIDAILSEL